MTDYSDFLQRKQVAATTHGFEPPPLHFKLSGFQRECVEFALRAGRSAMFLDTGLGKSFCSLEWAKHVAGHTNRPILILTPLAVAAQFVREGIKWGLPCAHVRDGSDIVGNGVYVTNYERLHLFDTGVFGGVVLDESSILKNFTGRTRLALQAAFEQTPYKLACTATPAPNDHMEIGQHAEFLGVMRSPEMLSRWFIADQDGMGKYRLKGHAVRSFWEWVASWARCLSKPSDLGYCDDGYILPSLEIHKVNVSVDLTEDSGDLLFRLPDTSATAIHKEKRLTSADRAVAVADVIRNEPSVPWIVWVDTDYDAESIMELLPAGETVEVKGKDKPEAKESGLSDFTTGNKRIIVTKPSIAGFGLNWQHCARQAFVGMSFSYEQFYQAIRRSWRFGQSEPVHVYAALAETEKSIWDTVARKREDHEKMKREMVLAMKRASRASRVMAPYGANQQMEVPAWLSAA